MFLFDANPGLWKLPSVMNGAQGGCVCAASDDLPANLNSVLEVVSSLSIETLELRTLSTRL